MKHAMNRFLMAWLGMGFLIAGTAAAQSGDNKGLGLLQKVGHTLDHMITLQCRVKRIERVNGEMESGDIRIKVNTQPRKIYIYNVSPHEGTELLYVDDWNDDKVYIHPNQFPWINMSFSPESDQLLKDQHHHVFFTGFVCAQKIVRRVLGKPDLHPRINYIGQQKYYGKTHEVVKIIHPDYKFVNYTVQAGENLLTIDDKLNVPSYKLLELNPECEDYFDVKAGQVIRVPNAYGKEIVLVIDPETNLPVVQLIYDDKGLFEKYEYSEIKLNPRFSTLEFSDENEAYGF